MKKDLTCVVLNGVPGSGKSTYKRHHCKDAPSFSADDIMERNGPYDFDYKILDLAHDGCFRDVTHECFIRASPIIVVDNTNTSLYEVLPYIRVAEAHGYKIKVVNLICDPEVAAKRCVHGVPADKIAEMHKRLMTVRAELREIADRFRKPWEFVDFVTDEA